LEGLEGLEPSTRGLRGRCSNQLSYRPVNEKNLLFSHRPDGKVVFAGKQSLADFS
jgi:hypothetical protein